MTLGPNDLLPCGTPTARRRHLARTEHCAVCGTPWPEPAAPVNNAGDKYGVGEYDRG